MTKMKIASAMLRAIVAIGIASGGITSAIAQTGNSMGGMQMAPGSKMDMKDKKCPLKSRCIIRRLCIITRLQQSKTEIVAGRWISW